MKIKKQYHWTILVFFLIILSTVISIRRLGLGDPLCDLNVYTRAINDHIAGGNPYRLDANLLFVYHPYILELFTWINRFIPLKLVLLSFYGITIIFFSLQFFKHNRDIEKQQKIKINQSIIWPAAGAVAYGGAGLLALKTGNMTMYLHMLLITLFLEIIKHNTIYKKTFFYTSIFFSAIIKPYYLGYLILFPYFLNSKKSALTATTIVLATVATWLSAPFFTDDLYRPFVEALSNQTLGRGDLGYTIFGLMQEHIGTLKAIALHVIAFTALAVSFKLTFRKSGYSLYSRASIPLAIIFIILSNPRMKVYDFCIAVLFAYTFVRTWSPENLFYAMTSSLLITMTAPIIAIFNKMGIIGISQYEISGELMQTLGFASILLFIFIAIRSMPENTQQRQQFTESADSTTGLHITQRKGTEIEISTRKITQEFRSEEERMDYYEQGSLRPDSPTRTMETKAP